MNNILCIKYVLAHCICVTCNRLGAQQTLLSLVEPEIVRSDWILHCKMKWHTHIKTHTRHTLVYISQSIWKWEQSNQKSCRSKQQIGVESIYIFRFSQATLHSLCIWFIHSNQSSLPFVFSEYPRLSHMCAQTLSGHKTLVLTVTINYFQLNESLWTNILNIEHQEEEEKNIPSILSGWLLHNCARGYNKIVCLNRKLKN